MFSNMSKYRCTKGEDILMERVNHNKGGGSNLVRLKGACPHGHVRLPGIWIPGNAGNKDLLARHVAHNNKIQNFRLTF